MTGLPPVTQGAAGLALALSFALLGTWRPRNLIRLCAIQAAVVAAAALTQALEGFAAVALAEAALLAWKAGQRSRLIETSGFPPPVPPLSPARIATGGGLAVLATATPAGGIGLAIVLLGLLLLSEAQPQRQALGVVTLQNGLLLAGIAGWRPAAAPLLPLAVPLLPVAAFIGLWLPHARRRARRPFGPAVGKAEAALCALALLAACALPWLLGHGSPFWLIDARAVHIALLLAALATAASWRDRHADPTPGIRLALLAGTAFAVLSASALASWLGMAVAALSAAAVALPRRPQAWRRLMLATAGLALALSGIISLYAQPSNPAAGLPAAGLLALGYGCLAVLAPELAVAGVALVLRIPAGIAGHLLLPAGLAALLLAAAALLRGGARQETLPLVDLAQAGVAVFAFGLGTPAADLAGLLQLTLLALTRCATRLAGPDSLDLAAALAGLAGVPPFGLFASLALILSATAASDAWLLLPLGAGLAAVAWALLPCLPARFRLAPSPAWLPLALALLCGLAMPGPLLAWFSLAAR